MSRKDKKTGVKAPSKSKLASAERGVSTAQRVFGKVLEKVDPKTKG